MFVLAVTVDPNLAMAVEFEHLPQPCLAGELAVQHRTRVPPGGPSQPAAWGTDQKQSVAT